MRQSTKPESNGRMGRKFLHPKSRLGFSRQGGYVETLPSKCRLQSGCPTKTLFREHRSLVLSRCPSTLHRRKSPQRWESTYTMRLYLKPDHPIEPAHGCFQKHSRCGYRWQSIPPLQPLAPTIPKHYVDLHAKGW